MYHDQDKKRFGIILAIIGGLIFVVGLFFFSGRFGGNRQGGNEPAGVVNVWGTLPQNVFSQLIPTITEKQKNIGLVYTEVPAESLKNSLTEAIANDTAPDMLLADTATLYSVRNLLEKIPYTSYPENGFRQTFASVTHILLEPDGIFGIPVGIDPVVLYYNREILANAGYALPPQTWDQAFEMAPYIINVEKGQLIRQAILPFGQYKNVSNALASISSLLVQARVPIVYLDPTLNTKMVDLKNSSLGIADAGQNAIQFFVQFSDPKSQFYTWNRSMLDSVKEFTQGRLALMPNYASIAQDLRNRNPNLNFAIAPIPQLSQDYQATYANIYAASILKKAPNLPASYVVLFEMVGQDFQKGFAQSFLIAPAQNELLMQPPETTYLPTVYKSALIARTWYNDNTTLVNSVFSQMVDSIISGRQSLNEAISEAESALKGDGF